MLPRRLPPAFFHHLRFLSTSRPSVTFRAPRNADVLNNPVVNSSHGLPRHALGPYRYNSTSTGKRPVDVKIEDLSELYASAKDEFEIAVEETSKNTIYARDDRETAREEFEKFRVAYEEALTGGSEEEAAEIKRRVGQRVREMEAAMETLTAADHEEH